MKFYGIYEISSDASGKLILPNGITVNNTIRVKQIRTYNCTAGCKFTEVIYRWYGKDVHYPLLVIIENMNDKGETTSTLTAYHPVSPSEQVVEENNPMMAKEGFNLNYYPNPWGKKLSIDYTIPDNEQVEVSLYDYTGNLVKTIVPKTQQEKGTYSLSVTDESMKAGVYFLKIKHGSKVITKKLIKAF